MANSIQDDESTRQNQKFPFKLFNQPFKFKQNSKSTHLLHSKQTQQQNNISLLQICQIMERDSIILIHFYKQKPHRHIYSLSEDVETYNFPRLLPLLVFHLWGWKTSK